VTALALRNPIAILMLCIGICVFAAVVTPRMSVDTFPELTPPVLIIGTLAPGLGPKDVEKTVSWRLEKYVSATPGIDHVESVSRNNLSIIYVWLKWGTDLGAAQTLVQAQCAFAMAAIPKSLGILPPFVLQYDPSNAPVVQVVVSGAGYTGPQLYDYAFNNIEPLLEGISGVASAAPDGGRMRQINVVVDPVKVQARNLTAADVAAAVRNSNALLPSGEFISKQFDANVYTDAIPQQVKKIGEAPIKVEGNREVLISDVARVEDSGTPPTQAVSVDGKDAVYLNVLRIPGGNTIEIVDAVKNVVENLKALPPGMQVKAVFDQSTFVRTTYHGLKTEVLRALVLISLVILVFLQSMRGTAIVGVAIPLSFAITLIVLYATGQTLNAFTLGGLTLAMGRLVDDAVVVLESIHRHQRMGLDVKRAALEGTNAVALPVLASTLTTMAVLLPVVLLVGLARKLFVPLALTVAVSEWSSRLVSMAVTPVACRYVLGNHLEHGRIGKAVEGFIDGIADAYSRGLRKALPYRFTIIGACGVLVLASMWAAGRLPSTFFPEIDESMDMVYLRFAPGMSVDEASAQLNAIGKAVSRELPPHTVETVIGNIGTPQNARAAIVSPNSAPNAGFLRFQFADPEKRKLTQSEIADRVREIIVREFPGVEALQYPGGLVASVFANGYIAPLVVEVRGENLAEMDEQANAIAEVARTVPGIADIRTSLQNDYPELRVDTPRDKAGLVGVTSRQAAEATLEATLGNVNEPGVWVDASNGQSYYVVTFYDNEKVGDRQGMGQLPVRVSTTGQAVLLGSYGTIRRSLGPIVVERNHLERAEHVLMQVERRDLGTTASALETALKADPRTSHVRYEFVGQVQLMRQTFSGLGLALWLAVMVVFMIMASQFKSIRLPFVMAFTIPVSLTGIVLALMGAGQGFSITALMGILMVIGISVSNGILLVDDANRRFQEGADMVDAIVAGARSRFVPIAMTSLATIIGLIPTGLAMERGGEANQPLALAVIGGLTSSTILSLFLVPVMFLFFAKRTTEEDVVYATHAHSRLTQGTTT
jgi:multidrug efflux pump subunit AcrB